MTFFQLGGDSIISIQLNSRIKRALNISTSIKDIFKYRTVRSLYAKILTQQNNDVKLSIRKEQGLLSGEVKLLPIQKWFFQLVENSTLRTYNHWNQSFIIKTPLLEIDILSKSIQVLLEYHDMLRAKYIFSDGIYRQYYTSSASPINLSTIDISRYSSEEIEEKLSELQSHFDIQAGKLWTIAYLYGYLDGSARIFFAAHHLIIDAVSWRIIKDHISLIYNHLLFSGNDLRMSFPAESILGEKQTSYRQWCELINQYGDNRSEERKYWDDYTKGNAQWNNIITEKLSDIRHQDYFSIDQTTTSLLLHQIHHVYNTDINDILLSALAISLKYITGQSVNYAILEGHGREQIFDDVDVSSTIGWFTTMYPVKLVCHNNSIQETIISVKDLLRSIPNKGVGYGAIVGYQTLSHPLVSFNYLGQFDKKNSESQDWSFSGEPSGKMVGSGNVDPTALNINGMVIGGELRFSVSSKLSEESAHQFVLDFKKNLYNIADTLTKEQRSYLTVSDIDNIVSAEYLSRIQKNRDIKSIYKANSLQQGFIYHSLNQGDIDNAYRVQLIWEYNDPINIEQMKAAWVFAGKKYPSLRLGFLWEENLIQVIYKEIVLD